MFAVYGDVNKILLGSFDPDYDHLDEDDSHSMTSQESSDDYIDPTQPGQGSAEAFMVRGLLRQGTTDTVTPGNMLKRLSRKMQ
jgi:hypothetical protein